MKASAWQKAVNEDQDNDFVHAIDSAKRRIVEPAEKFAHKQAELHSKYDALQREHEKLREEYDELSAEYNDILGYYEGE